MANPGKARDHSVQLSVRVLESGATVFQSWVADTVLITLTVPEAPTPLGVPSPVISTPLPLPMSSVERMRGR